MKPVSLVGGGGHARVVIGILRALSQPILGIFDDDESVQGSLVLGIEVLGRVSDAEGHAVLAIGDNRTRQFLSSRCGLTWVSLVHPSAWVDPTVLIGEGVVVCAGAVIQPESKIGSHSIINTSATVDHECTLEDCTQIAPGANLGGRVRVGEGAFVGIGSSVIQGVKLGSWSIVGAGAAVIEDVPSGVTVVGVPARSR